MQRQLIKFTRRSDAPDADFSHLRGEAVLEKLLRSHPGDAAGLQRAHRLLRDEPNYAPAMHRVAHSLHEGSIRAFISYRVGVDAEAARTIAEIFRALSMRKVEVTFADEFTARISGQDYKSEIEAATKAAHWFLILLSESTEPSGWCMYETGLFRASATSRRMERLICLHHPNATLPSAIDGFQAVQGSIERLQSFLDGLFRQPDPLPGWEALNPSLDDATILEAATRIAHALRPPRKPVGFNPRVTLIVDDPARIATPADLDACEVVTDRLTANLFGKVAPPRSWGELVANVAPVEGQARWLDELVAVLRKAAAGNVVRPITASIDCAQGGRVVRPVLLEMEHNGDGGEFRFHLIFLEEFSTPAGRSMPPRVRTLLAAVRMHNRVRWEVLERFNGASWSAEEREACAKALSRIDREWRSQGGFDARALREHYAEPAADEVVELFEDWLDLLASPSGPLPRALGGQDATQVRDALIRCRALNQRFFEITFPVLEALTRG